jgi:hypothetical protein
VVCQSSVNESPKTQQGQPRFRSTHRPGKSSAPVTEFFRNLFVNLTVTIIISSSESTTPERSNTGVPIPYDLVFITPVIEEGRGPLPML